MKNTTDGPSILPDHEVPAAMRELFENEGFVRGMNAFLPPEIAQKLLEEAGSVQSKVDFQRRIAVPLFSSIEKESITELTTSGLEKLDPARQYLFISNHRDIILDSAFLNTTLLEHGFRTSQIAIGDNLMKHRTSELIFNINKSFVVRRTGSPMELYRYSMRLSEHIRRQISDGIDSVWIAQREGRAKNGDDRTQPGLLKMLSLSAPTNDLKAHFQSLQIVPVAISYEQNPCDLLHAQEFLNKQADPNFKKSFDEDLQHILLGLKGPKGRVHLHFDKPLAAELDFFDAQPNPKKQLEALAEHIDQSIHRNYRLHPINEAAFQMQHGQPISCCPPDEAAKILHFFDEKRRQLSGDDDGLGWQFLLGIYANPFLNGRDAGRGAAHFS